MGHRPGPGQSISPHNPEFRVCTGFRIAANPDIKLFRFHDPLLGLWTPEFQFLAAERERHGALFSRAERDSLETLQLADWA